MGWIGTSVLMMKTQIGLGVLSIPAAFDTLGLLPGVICLLTVAIITTWSNYIVGVFKVNHPEVYGIDDASKLMFGTIGREVLSAGFSLCKSPQTQNLNHSLLTRPDSSPDFRCRIRHARHFDRLECNLDTWRMHCYFCCGCSHWGHNAL